MDDPSNFFRQKPQNVNRGNAPQEAIDAAPSEQSGTVQPRIGVPVWKKFVSNTDAQELERGAIQSENLRTREAAIFNRQAESSSSSSASSSASPSAQRPLFKGAKGRLLRVIGGKGEELDPEQWANDPEAGPHARRSLWEKEIDSARRDSEEASFALKDPSFHTSGLSDKERADIETQGSVLAESDPQHAALKARLIADDQYRARKAELAQRAYDSEARARQLESTDPEAWWQTRNTPKPSEQRAAVVAEAQQERKAAQAADDSAAEELAQINQQLTQGVTGAEMERLQARRREIAEGRASIAQTAEEAEKKVEQVREQAKQDVANPENRGFFGNIVTAAVRGYAGAAQAANILQGADDATNAQDIARNEALKQRNPASKEFQDFMNAEGTWESAKAFLKNPVRIISEVIAESAAQMVPGIALGATGGAIGGAVSSAPTAGTAAPATVPIGAVIGSAVGAGSGSFLAEYGSAMMEAMQEAGMDATSPESIQKFFTDPAALEKAKEFAVRRGVAVGVFDAVSAGLAGKFMKPVQVAAKAGQKVSAGAVLAATGKEVAAQAAAGATGEAAGQLASTGEIKDGKSIFLEGIAEVGSAPIEVASNLREFQSAGATPPAAEAPAAQPETPDQVLERVSAEVSAIDPEAAPPTAEEMAAAVMIAPRSPAEGVLVERELAQVEAEDAETMQAAEQQMDFARQSGDKTAIRAAQDELDAYTRQTGRAPMVRAVLKIASGQELDDLTDAELRSVGAKTTKTGFAPMSPKEMEKVGIKTPMLRDGADGSLVLTDAALEKVAKISTRARTMVKLTEAEALQRAKQRAQQALADQQNGAAPSVEGAVSGQAPAIPGDPATGVVGSSDETNAAANPLPVFEVPMRVGPPVQVQAQTAADAEAQAAKMFEPGQNSVLPGQARPISQPPQQSNEISQPQQAQGAPVDQAGAPIDPAGTSGGTGINPVAAGSPFIRPGTEQVAPTPSVGVNESPAGAPQSPLSPSGAPQAPGKPRAAETKARAKLAKAKKTLGDRLNEGPARAETFPDRITINPRRIIEEAISRGMTDDQAVEYFDRVLDEEIRHLAQYDAAKVLFRAAGSPGDFLPWMDRHYAGIWQSDFVATGKDAIIRDLYGRSESGTTEAWNSMSDSAKALEAIRMMSQGDSVTEQAKLWINISDGLRQALKAALIALKKLRAAASPAIQSEITNLENALARLTGTTKPSTTSSGNPEKQPSSRPNRDGDGQAAAPAGTGKDAGVRGADPDRLETPASPLVAGARVEFDWKGRKLTGVVRLVKNGAVSVFPDENPEVSVGPIAAKDVRVLPRASAPSPANQADSTRTPQTDEKDQGQGQGRPEGLLNPATPGEKSPGADIEKYVTTYSNYHLARIAREAKSGKQRPEYYEQQREQWTPNRVRGRVVEFLRVIDNKDVATLVGYNNGMFDGFWKLFGMRTGMNPMPKTQKGIEDVIRSYVGDEAYNANEKALAESRAKRAEESAAKDQEYRIKRLKQDAERIVFQDGQNGAEWVDQTLAEGWRVENVSNGPVPRYAFIKGNAQKKFTDAKQVKPLIDYGREAQKGMPDPVDEEAVKEEAEFNALPQQDKDAIESLFTPGGTKPFAPALTPAEEQAKKDLLDAFEGLIDGLQASELPSGFRERPPVDRLPQFQKAAQSIVAAGVDGPEKLAVFLEKIAPGKLRTFSEFLWRQVNSFLMGDNVDPDWASIYAQINQDATNENGLPADAGAGEGAQGDAENPRFEDSKRRLIGAISSDVATLLLADEEVTVDRVRKLHPLSSTLTRKELDETIEAGITSAAHQMVAAGRSPEAIYKRLIGLYGNQPSLNAKTSTSKINQAFSTPAPLAYVASRLADISGGKVLTEPTGGHGMLMMESNPDQVVQFNELDPARRERTKIAIPNATGWKMTGEDATAWNPDQTPDRIAANPPFGSLMGEDGENIVWQTAAGETKTIDHAIMLGQLETLAEDGRAVFIIGGPAKTARSESARKDHYGRGSRGAFFKHLHENFGVVDHFTVDGDLYAKQGAGWNVDVILIQGRKPSRTALPSAKVPRMISTWAELFQTTQLTDEDRIQINRLTEAEIRDSVRNMVDALAGIGGVGGSKKPGVRPEQGGGKDGVGRPVGASSAAEFANAQPESDSGAGGVDGIRDGGSQSGSDPGSGPVSAGNGAGVRQPAGGQNDSAGAVRGKVREVGKFQAEYKPFSGEKGLDTLLPKNMVEPVADAFDRIKKDLGDDLTGFVREKLGYPEGTDITKYLAGEQIDAVAAAIWNFQRGGALIIGDQTGIGKGRIAAALMKYAVNQGFTPIFMTKDPGLHDAMITEDLADIAATEIIPAVMDTKLQFDSAKDRKLEYGKDYFEEAARAGSLPGSSNAVFVTYDQIQADDAKGLDKKERARARAAGQPPRHSWRMTALKALAPNAVVILDESHLASGQSTRGWRVADVLSRCPRVYYSSATSVKRPENMGIYFKTNVGSLTGGDMNQLASLMNSGGVPAMQVVSSMLSKDGQYLRRERSFEGVKFATYIAEESSERDRFLADNLTGSLRQIVTVQDAMRQAAEAINNVIAAAGKKMKVPAANRAKLETVNFSSKLHNIVSQYLLAIKTLSVAEMAISEIRSGKKVVVGLQSTMESAIDGLENGGFEMSYKGLVLRYLDQMRFLKSGNMAFGRGEVETFEITETGPPEFEDLSSSMLETMIVTTEGDGNGDTVILINEKVAAELMRRSMWDVFAAARDEIEKVDLGDLPISPIDAMRQAVEQAGIRTGEITGRKRGIDENGEIYVRSAEERSKPFRRLVQSEFNNKDLNFLVINQSGSTGISLHASEKAKNKAKRVMILAQPNLDINEFMQMLGRIHRSGQVTKPEFIDFQTALPAEKRPAAIRGRKMSMLNANTTSNSKTDVSEGNTAIDIFNQYGDEVAYRILERDPDLQEQLRPLGSALAKFFDSETGKLKSFQDALSALEDQPDGYISRTITGYLAILPVEEQEIFWDRAISDYQAYIAYLDQIGQNALEAKALDLKAKTVDREVFTEKGPGETAFDEESYIETVETKAGKEPLTGEEAVALSRKGKEESRAILRDYLAMADAAAEAAAEKKAKRSLKWDDEKRSDFMASQRAQRNTIANAISLIGRFGNVKRDDGNPGLGVIEEIRIDKEHPLTPSKQVAVIRVNDSRETMRVPVTQLSEAFTPDPNESAKEWNETTDIGGERMIATGNLMAAMKALGGTGKVITYTTEEGVDKMGILLPKSFAAKRQAAKNLMQIDTPEKLSQRLDAGFPVTNADGSVKWTKGATVYSLSVPASRSRGGEIWRHPVINRLSYGGEFTQVSGEMRASFDEKNMPQVFEILTGIGEKFVSKIEGGSSTVSDDTAAFGRFIDQQEGRSLQASTLPDAEPFYSQLARIIESKMPKSATPQQVVQIATSGGAKAEEVKWSGLVPWLQGREKVSKDEVLEFLRNEGAVRFEEVKNQGQPLFTSELPEPQTVEAFRERGRRKVKDAMPLIKNAEQQMAAFGPGSMGNDPKFANFGGDNQEARNQVEIARAYDTFMRETRADRDTFEKARELLAKDPAGVEELALGSAYGDGRMAIADHEQIAIEMLIQRKVAEAGDDRAKQIDNYVLIQANIINRRENARTMRIGYDKFMTPQERMLQKLGDLIFTVTPKVEARAKTLPMRQRKAYLAEAGKARLEQVEKELAKLGLRISQVIGENRRLQAENSKAMQEVMKTRKLMDQAVLKMIQQGASVADIRRRYGKDAAESAQEVNSKAREELAEKIRRMLASGMTRDDIRKSIGGLQSSPLPVSAMSKAEMDALIEEMLAVDFGLPAVVPERPLPSAKPKRKTEKLDETNVLSADWSRPVFTDALASVTFDTKDRAGIMERVEIIRNLAGAVGKIGSLEGRKREQAEAKLAEINAILAKYGTDANGVFQTSKGIESYGFDLNDIGHVAAVARAINSMDADVVDKATEYFYSSMLSGLQTMFVNATALVPAVWESTVGRGVNMAINSALRMVGMDSDMAEQVGEAKYILRAMRPALTRAMSNFQASMAAQHPMFDRDVNAMDVDLDKILGGGSHRMIGSIGGRKGDIIRLPMRLLMATDDFNRTLLACCEVGAFAYRVAKAKGLTPGSPKFDQFLREELNQAGSFSYQLASQKASRLIYSNPLPGQKDPHTGERVPVRDLGDLVGYIAFKITDAVSKEHENLFLKAVAAAFRVSFFPFQRTPFNIMRKGIRHTLNPFSLFDIGLGIVQNVRTTNQDGTTKWEWKIVGDSQAADERRLHRAELIERMGQQLQGAVLMALLLGTSAGEGDEDDLKKPLVITGSLPFLPANMAERDARMRSGIGAFRVSFRRGDGSERFGFSYGRVEPVATLLSATIDTIKAVKRSNRSGGSNYDAAAAALGGFVSQAQDKTFMRGIGDLIALAKNVVAEPDNKENRKALQFLAGRLAMIVPNIIRQPIREMDPQFRERTDSFMEELLYQMAPAGQKPGKVDPYGEPITKPGNPLVRAVDFLDVGTDKANPIDRMLIQWQDSGKWKDAPNPDDRKPWFPSPINNVQYRNARTNQIETMTPEQAAEFRNLAGKRAMALLKLRKLNIDNPSAYDIEQVKEIISKAREDMKKALVAKYSRQ